MKNDVILPLVIVLGVAVLGIITFLSLRNDRHVWHETLRTNAEEPYDLSVFKDLIESSSTDFTYTEKSVLKTLKAKTGYNYFRLSDQMDMDSLEIDTLFKFVERGNNAFIAINHLPVRFYDEFDRRQIWLNYGSSYQAKSVQTSFFNDEDDKPYPFEYKGYNEEIQFWWRYFHDSNRAVIQMVDQNVIEEAEENVDFVVYATDSLRFDTILNRYVIDEYDDTVWYGEHDYDLYDEKEPMDTAGWALTKPLGYFRNTSDATIEYTNFCVAEIGDGQMFIHSNPIMFSNYFLLKKEGFIYSNSVLSELPNNPIIWDDHYYYQPYEYTVNEPDSRSPLKFVFEHPPLKYAWYTLLLGTLLFLLFRSKRKQNVIPIIPPVENTSIAFAQSLGVLYHQSGSGRYLALEMMKLFNNFNRRNYRIHRKVQDDQLAEKISQRSRVPVASIEKILTLEKQIVYNPSSEIKEVVKLHDELEAYYKQARK